MEFEFTLNENDKKIQSYEIKKWIILTLYVAVIVLEVLALFNIIDVLWGCGLFVIIYLLKFKKIL